MIVNTVSIDMINIIEKLIENRIRSQTYLLLAFLVSYTVNQVLKPDMLLLNKAY